MDISHSKSPIFDQESKQLGEVIVFRDITREIAMRERMERITKLDSIGILAGGIAHDFNNLLSGLFGYLELAATSTDIQEIHSYIEKTGGVFERARNLTSQLLTFAKGGAPVLKVGDIAGVVRDATLFALSGSSIRCRFDIQEDLALVEFDENQISRVVDNIVINAKQAMPDGGSIRVSVENCELTGQERIGLQTGEYVEIAIQDFGEGIPHEMLQRIFDPFLTTRKNGNGLGLSTSHSIVHRHGGGIDVESEPGQGSTFYLYLPVSEGRNSLGATSVAGAIHKGKGIVLVLDDEAVLRDISVAMLTSMDYDVICFEEGQPLIDHLQSLSASAKSAIVAALFDLTIPGGLGGAEVVAQARHHLPGAILIAVSGYSAGDVMSNPLAFGFTDSLAKPFRKRDLSNLLQKYFPH